MFGIGMLELNHTDHHASWRRFSPLGEASARENRYKTK
jgi:hypothetical protein